MKVSKEAYSIATKIIETFDPDYLKAKQVDNIDQRIAELDTKLKDLVKPVEANSTTSKYQKWDLIDKQISLEEEKVRVAETDFTKEAEVKEMFGCARDHSKEIDIYNKTYE
jgi:hypothetical protein